MSFGNSAGAWALLALAAVLAIHTLQRRRRTRVVSGLFLLGADPPPARGGRWIERLRRSPSLWLQLAAASLLAWLLLDPRVMREESAQRVVVVLDSSASMSAWRDRAADALAGRLEEIGSEAAHTEWVLLESGDDAPALYSGAVREALGRALETWDPTAGAHDPGPALDTARHVAGREGRVLFLTDRDVAVPAGVERLAVGEPRDNVGFAGLSVDEAEGEPRWRALVRSYSDRPERRRLFVEAGGARRELEPVALAPGELRRVSGGFPPARAELVLALEADAFALDDRLAVVRPRRKPLVVALDLRARADETVERLLATLDAVEPAGEGKPAALAIRFGESGVPAAPRAIVFAPGAPVAEAPGAITAERHPLVEGPSWHGLLLGPNAGLRRAQADRVLVWYGQRALVALRSAGGGDAELRIGLSPSHSNAGRHAALPLLLHRFAEAARAARPGFERRNVETHQPLEVALDPAAGAPRLVSAAGEHAPGSGGLHAPARPGLFHVRQDGAPLLTAAARFADVREADLRGAVSFDETRRASRTRLRQTTRPDPLGPLWLLLAGALMACDWSLPGRAR